MAAAPTADAVTLTSLAGNGVPPLSVGQQNSGASIMDVQDSYIRMSNYLHLFGKLPKHVEIDIRERSRYVQHLDPDIASKRSWSLQIKILTQQERNYQREIERYRRMGTFETAQKEFAKLTGFRWEW